MSFFCRFCRLREFLPSVVCLPKSGFCSTSGISSSIMQPPQSSGFTFIDYRQHFSGSQIAIALFHTDYPSPRYLPCLLFLLPVRLTVDILHVDILNRPPRLHVLRFLPCVAPGGPRYLPPGGGADHAIVPLVWRALDCAWYPLGAQESRCGFCPVILTQKEAEPPEKKDIDSPKLTTDIDKDNRRR